MKMKDLDLSHIHERILTKISDKITISVNFGLSLFNI